MTAMGKFLFMLREDQYGEIRHVPFDEFVREECSESRSPNHWGEEHGIGCVEGT
jgi:hypothetical protein